MYDATLLTLDTNTLPSYCDEDPLGTVTCNLTSTGEFMTGTTYTITPILKVINDSDLLQTGTDPLVFTSSVATNEEEWTYVDNQSVDSLPIVSQGLSSIAGTVYGDNDA